MKSKLIKLTLYSGNKASVYGVWFDDLKETSFDFFLNENKNVFISELKDISTRLKIIGNVTGAKEQFFKNFEGNPGDGVCALFDLPDKKLRLYCIRYRSLIVIVGGGGPKVVQKLQQDAKLKKENYFLRNLSALIIERLKEGELWFSEDNKDFEGNLEFNDEENE